MEIPVSETNDYCAAFLCNSRFIDISIKQLNAENSDRRVLFDVLHIQYGWCVDWNWNGAYKGQERAWTLEISIFNCSYNVVFEVN